MCGRYASYTPPAELLRWFRGVGDVPNRAPTWNLAPTQGAMVLRRHPGTGERRLDELKWGLIPHFTSDVKAARKPINVALVHE
jgi:putative SOS response-associated peptidase YedK